MGFRKTKYYHLVDGCIYLEAQWRKLPFLKQAQFRTLEKSRSLSQIKSFLVFQKKNKSFLCQKTRGEIRKEKFLVKNSLKNFEVKKKVLSELSVLTNSQKAFADQNPQRNGFEIRLKTEKKFSGKTILSELNKNKAKRQTTKVQKNK